MSWFNDIRTNFKSNLHILAQKAGAIGKFVWSNIPHILQGAKVLGKALNNAGIPVGSAISAGADIVNKIYDGFNELTNLVNAPVPVNSSPPV